MTGTNSKIRALFLAGLMVLSVFAMTTAFTGSVAAEHGNSTDRGSVTQWNPIGTSASGNVGVGSSGSVVVFQGEDGIDNLIDGTSVTPESYSNGDGDVLQLPIPEDQPTGSYTGDGTSDLVVRTPRITSHDIENEDGASVAGGTVPSDDNTLTLTADYNFQEVTHLQVVIRRGGEDGIEVTNKVLDSGDDIEHDSSGEVSWTVDKSELQTDTQYSVTFRSQSSDLRHGAGTQSTTIDVGSEDVSLSLDPDETVQGEDVTYTVEGGEEGNYFLTWIESGGVADDADPEDVFEATGSTVSGYDHNHSGTPYAVVEIDDGTGVGSIDTTALDTTDVTVYTANVSTSWVEGDGIPDDDTDADLTVNEGDVTLENPTATYVPGSEVTVNGTTSTGINEVTMYARDQGIYHRVGVDGQNTMSVSGGEFEVEDADLTDGAFEGNNILSYPGNYRIALVAGDRGDTMTTTQVAQNVSDTHTLRVAEGEMSATVSIVNGQVAVGDQVDVEGVAEGSDEINVTFFGPRGTVDSVSGISVDETGTFERENIAVGGNLNNDLPPGIDSDISEGTVIMSVFTNGRDDVRGDGTPPSAGSFGALVAQINGGQYTQQQAIDRMSAETSDDTGSDDISQTFQFRYTDARTTVDNVVGEAGVNGTAQIGSELTIAGTTNRQPEDTTITVEVIEGPSQTDFDVATTEEWPLTGNWNVTLDSEGLQPGTYTVEASDGTSSDILEFQLQEDSPDPEEPTDTETTDTETTDTETTDTETTDTEATETTGQDGPGFGLVAAIVGLLAAALLAVRRNS